MKRRLLFIVIITLVTLLFVGCGKRPNVTVKVYDLEENILFDQKVDFTEEDTLLSLLQNNKKIALKGSTSEYGFFITEMCGVNSFDFTNTFWSIKVNGVDSMEGISDIDLKDNDIITFTLIEFSIGSLVIEVIDLNNNYLFNSNIQYYEGDTLLTLLQNHEGIALKGQYSEYGFFVTELCGVNSQNIENTFWSIKINGVDSMVGISDINLQDKDVISFTLIDFTI